MLSKLRNRLAAQEGFTLIELLVVILIIGILAAIAIPSFLNQKGKGEDAAAKSAARATQTAIETYYTDHNSYDCAATCDTDLHTIEPSLPTFGTAGGDVQVTGTSDTGYTIVAYSKPSLRQYKIVNTGGAVVRSCTVSAGNNGGCVNSTW